MRWLWSVVVLVLVAGACSDSDDGTTGAVESTAVTVPSDSPSGGVSTTPEIVAPVETTVEVGSDVDACVLVDADDATSVLGSPAVVDTTPTPSFGETSSCVWNTESEALMVVSVFDGREFYSGDGLPGSEALAVGDTGYIVVEPNLGGVDLQVVKGDWVVSLTVTPFGVADVEGLPETMAAAAERAIDRLP